MLKSTLAALAILAAGISSASAFTPASSSLAGTVLSPSVIEAQYRPHTRSHVRPAPRYVAPRYVAPRYVPGRRYATAPRGWNRYGARPGNWRTRGCVMVGPIWFCP